MPQSDRDRLAYWRSISARRSTEILDIAPTILGKGGLGDEEWAIREQLAFAALDMGALGLAEAQITALRRRFPNSPRVSILMGMHLEATNEVDEATKLYNSLIKKDETHIAAHQRLIALLLPSGPAAVIPGLLSYLDTFHTDADAWTLLAEQYAEAGLYEQSLGAWGHVMVIQPWESGVVARAAGVAYTSGDVQLSLKYYLRAIEMTTPPEGKLPDPDQRSTRLWWGVRKCTSILLQTEDQAPSSVPPQQAVSIPKLQALQALATERILDSASKGSKEVLGISREVLSS